MPEPPATSSSGPPSRRLPDEVAADRARAARSGRRRELVGEVGRDLAVVEPLDGELEAAVLGRRGDRVAALRLVAVLGGQPDVDVLAGAVAGPVGRRRSRASSRCGVSATTSTTSASCQERSVAPVPLLPPWVSVVVVAVRLPEAGLVVVGEAAARAPTWRSSRSRGAGRAGAPGRRARARAARRRSRTRPTPCRRVTSSSGRFVV